MIAIDTNVLVRLIVADDPEQTRRARALAAEGPMFATFDTKLVRRGKKLAVRPHVRSP
jgi:hypothetical protein